ncbi:MAG TPA: hypothetical protein VK540_12810 [Polyangiaceae bacterium]|nr:hypothetical protein [Polyangiaceae bacterium]
MTPQELADILEKAEAVPPLKTTFDASFAAYNAAVTNAANARAAWLSGVDSNADEPTLTGLATQYVATAVARANAMAAMQAAATPKEAADADLEAACQAAISATLNP